MMILLICLFIRAGDAYVSRCLPQPLHRHGPAFWAAAFLTVAASLGFGQTQSTSRDYHAREWHLDDGLPSEDVMQLLQDRAGYLWVATRAGLAHFDGSHFTPPRDPQGSAYFLDLAEDLDGSLLCVPRNGDPLRYRDGKFIPEPLPAAYRGQLIQTSIITDDGSRWVSLTGTVLHLRKDGFDVYSENEGIAAQSRPRFAIDEQRRLWISSGPRLLRWENGKLAEIPFVEGGPEPRIAPSRRAGPWVITDTHVYKYDEADRPVEIAAIPPLIGAHYVTSTCEDVSGDLWIGTRSQGVYKITSGTYIHIPTSHDDVYALIADHDGTIWAGINNGGLNAISPKIYRQYNKSAGLMESTTFSLCEDAAGDMWLGNGDGGLARIHGEQIFTEVVRFEGRIFGVVSVSPASDGVWFTGAPGLFRARADSPGIEHITTVPRGGARRITFTAKNGDLWLSLDPDRVCRMREGHLQIFGPAEGFDGRDARAMVEDADGKIWIGTSDGRIFSSDGKRFDRVPLPPSPRPTGGINTILFFDSDTTLVGTAQAGLVALTGGRAIALGSEQGLPADDVTQIVQDPQGDLWCGTSRGIFRLQRREAQHFIAGKIARVGVYRVGKDDGLRSAACAGIYGPAATVSRDGRVWFATRQGVLAITPTAPILTPTGPVVRIEEIRCNDDIRPLAKTVIVRGDNRKLEIGFSVLCLSAPGRAQTRYRLEGFDRDWVFAGNNHTASYPRLTPGEYVFSVRTSFDLSDRKESVDTLTVVVPPLWWQRPWLFAAGFLLLVAAITAAVRGWSHRRLRLRLEKLERETAIARERARIAQNIHDDVGASLTRISLLTQAASPEPGQQENNLARIYETTREITRSLDEIVWAVNPNYDSLESFVDYLTSFAQKFLSVAGIRCRLQIPSNLPPLAITSQTRHDLFLCCREALNNVVKHSGATEVLLSLNLEGGRLLIWIIDNGRGADSTEVAVDRVLAGQGQKNMRERMSSLGGTCSIEPAPHGRGLVVTLELNLNRIRDSRPV